MLRDRAGGEAAASDTSIGDHEPSTTVRVLVAEPVGILRSGLKGLLDGQPDLEAVEAADLDEMTGALAAGDVKVALVDLALPPTGGIAALRHVRSGSTAIVWGFNPSRRDMIDAARAGAVAFLDKNVSPAELVDVVRRAARGPSARLSRSVAGGRSDGQAAPDGRRVTLAGGAS